MKIEQWDIVRFRINAADRDLHPGVVISAPEWCADERKLRLNVLACSKRPPADGNVFCELVNTVEVCSLGQITACLTGVVGKFRPMV